MNTTLLPLSLVIITVIVFGVWVYRTQPKTETSNVKDHVLIMILVTAVLGSGWMGALLMLFINQIKFT